MSMNKRRIVLVDDDADLRKTLAKMLESARKFDPAKINDLVK